MSKPLAIAIVIPLLSAVFAVIPANGSTGMVEPAGINMVSNEATYVLGESVQMTGRVDFPLDLNNLMRIQVFTPSGELYRIDEFKINSDGGFVWSFNLPSTEAGQWVVNARFSTRDTDVVLNVLQADVFDKIYVKSTGIWNVQGSNITASGGIVGEGLFIRATLVNDEQVSQSFMMIVQILDQDRAAKAMLLALGSLPAGESIERSVPWLPEEQGSYTAEIFVWSSLNDPTPLVEKHSVAFSVNSQ
jgi:hypothetical protein